MKAYRYDPETLAALVETCVTVADVMRGLGIQPTGGNHRTVLRYIRLYNLDTSHFLGQSHQRGKKRLGSRKGLPLSEIFVENSAHNHIRAIVKNNDLLPYRCSKCGIGSWNGEALSLHLDHINGVNNDNRIDNLRWLCPNCHSQTETYGNKKGRPTIIPAQASLQLCGCGRPKSGISITCRACQAETRKLSGIGCKITWPPTEELIEMVSHSSYSAVGRTLGVSDNAVRKRISTHA